MDFFFKYGGYLFTPMHILVCLVLIAVVLLQTGKSSDMAGVFGGAGTQTAFGPRGVENTLSKLTRYAAILFMVSSLGLSIIKTRIARDSFADLPSSEEVEAQSPAPSDEPAETTPDASTAPATTAPDSTDAPAESGSDATKDNTDTNEGN